MVERTTRAFLRHLYDTAVAAAQPAGCLAGRLPPPPKGRVVIIGAGKAGAAMVAYAEAHYRLDHGLGSDRLIGTAVARHGYGCDTGTVPLIEAGHPTPDEGSLKAAAAALAVAHEARAEDLVVVLLSGGGSANWVAPVDGLTLADKQAINKALLRSGAAIHEINTVRKHLSRIKGGRLAKAAWPAPVVTLAVSDVPGDDPATIASGPTVPDPTTLVEAREIVSRFGIVLPPAATAALADPANESPKPGDPMFASGRFEIVATPAMALKAAEAAARAAGYEVISLGADVEGEARAVAAAQARQALQLKADGRRAVILSGGELTVTIKGQGRGGPNQEFALALALALEGAAGISGLAGDTDGTDGGGGAATDPAGAIVDPTTLVRARAMGLDAAAFLERNDSTAFFERLGDLLSPGPTLTNVNDLRAVLIDPCG